jgi:N-acetyl-anhydromuramyl-L-alanine amidase AmpD
MKNKPTVVITHHTGGTDAQPLADSSNATVTAIDSWHKQRWPGFTSRAGWHVGYHYVIEKDGKVTQTRQHDEQGAHCIGMNSSSIGVSFAGNFDLTVPTPAQMQAWYTLYQKLQAEFPGIPTRPHRAYARKTCHGTNLADNYFAISYQRWTLTERLKQLRSQLATLLTNRRMR